MAMKKTKIVIRKKHGTSILIVSCAVLVLCAVLLINSFKIYGQLDEYDAVAQNLQEQIEQQVRESEQLDIESEYAKSEEYIEQLAREKLGLVKENELIFQKE